MPTFWVFTIEKRTCTCYSKSLLMEEVTDISPVKANSTNKSRSMHTVSLKAIRLQEMLENEDLLQYKYMSGEFKTSEQLYGDPKAAHFSCHTSCLFPRS